LGFDDNNSYYRDLKLYTFTNNTFHSFL